MTITHTDAVSFITYNNPEKKTTAKNKANWEAINAFGCNTKSQFSSVIPKSIMNT